MSAANAGGRRMLEFLSKLDFPSYFYHYNKKGRRHVAALHAHIENTLFFKIDIQNFYHSIARMRVTRALRHWGYPGAGTFSKWSCVVNPLANRHELPIGFVQSPLLATLVLMKSPVAQAIERAIFGGESAMEHYIFRHRINNKDMTNRDVLETLGIHECSQK
jgi:hypothetical protein